LTKATAGMTPRMPPPSIDNKCCLAMGSPSSCFEDSLLSLTDVLQRDRPRPFSIEAHGDEPAMNPGQDSAGNG
jgi:hypothetical protein